MSDEQQRPHNTLFGKQPLNWNTLICTICAVFVVAYNGIVTPAAASEKDRRARDDRMQAQIQQILDHQKWQDGRHDRLEGKMDTFMVHVVNADKQTAVTATRTDAIWKWIISSSQK